MNSLHKRWLLFLGLCIPIRFLIAYLVKNTPTTYLPYLGAFFAFQTIGFFSIYLTGSRQTGAEVFGEKIWWNSLRPLHGALHGATAFMAFNKDPYSFIPITIDTLIGLTAFFLYHSRKID